MRKLSFILMIFILLFSVLAVNANAEDLSFTTTLSPSSSSVSEATEVVITVAVSNLNVGESGINAFSALLSYDTDVFETLTDSSVEGLNGWNSSYTATNGQILLSKNSFVNEDEEIMQITLKTKEGVQEGTEGTVSLTGIEVSNSESQISGDNVSTTIKVGTETAEENTTNDAPIVINPITNQNTTENETNTSNTETNSTYNVSNINTNTPSDDMPYTGPAGDAFIKIILGVVLVALVIYIKIRKMDDVK